MGVISIAIKASYPWVAWILAALIILGIISAFGHKGAGAIKGSLGRLERKGKEEERASGDAQTEERRIRGGERRGKQATYEEMKLIEEQLGDNQKILDYLRKAKSELEKRELTPEVVNYFANAISRVSAAEQPAQARVEGIKQLEQYKRRVEVWEQKQLEKVEADIKAKGVKGAAATAQRKLAQKQIDDIKKDLKLGKRVVQKLEDLKDMTDKFVGAVTECVKHLQQGKKREAIAEIDKAIGIKQIEDDILRKVERFERKIARLEKRNIRLSAREQREVKKPA